jgi:hypothetical protein
LVSADQSNQLLAALPADEFELMKRHLADLELSLGEVLFNPGDIIRDVYFPTTAIVSMMNVMRDGQKVEVASATKAWSASACFLTMMKRLRMPCAKLPGRS